MKPLRSTYPASSLLGGAAYTPSVATDIRETLRRERERIDADRAQAMREAEERDEVCDD